MISCVVSQGFLYLLILSLQPHPDPAPVGTMMGNVRFSLFPYKFCLFSNPVVDFVYLHSFVSSVSISWIARTPALAPDLLSLPSGDPYI